MNIQLSTVNFFLGMTSLWVEITEKVRKGRTGLKSNIKTTKNLLSCITQTTIILTWQKVFKKNSAICARIIWWYESQKKTLVNSIIQNKKVLKEKVNKWNVMMCEKIISKAGWTCYCNLRQAGNGRCWGNSPISSFPPRPPMYFTLCILHFV